MNSKNGIRNIYIGIIGQLITLGFSIIIPRYFILSYGSEVNGLISSISQIYLYLSLLEAGIGTTTIQALYKPLSLNDRKSISGIISATNKYYNKIGIYYLVCVIMMSIIYPLVIKSTISKVTIMIIILLVGLKGTLNFFLSNKYKLLLQAEGRSYINILYTDIFKVICNVIKISMILCGMSIVIIYLAFAIVNVIEIIVYIIYIRKKYQWLDLKLPPDTKSLNQKNSVLIHQISSMIFYNTDIVLLTVFCDLQTVSIYALYNMIISMIYAMLSKIIAGITFIMGQTYYKNIKNYLKLNNTFEVFYTSLVFSLYLVVLIYIQPFMKLYTKGISDVNYIDKYLPLLFIAVKLLDSGRAASGNIINITGHFRSTRIRSIIESSINLLVSLVGVIHFGIYGVLLGTIVALLYRTNDMIIYANKIILKRSVKKTYLSWIINMIIFIILFGLNRLLNVDINNYGMLIAYSGVSAIIIIAIFAIINSLIFKEEYETLKNNIIVYYKILRKARK